MKPIHVFILFSIIFLTLMRLIDDFNFCAQSISLLGEQLIWLLINVLLICLSLTHIVTGASIFLTFSLSPSCLMMFLKELNVNKKYYSEENRFSLKVGSQPVPQLLFVYIHSASQGRYMKIYSFIFHKFSVRLFEFFCVCLTN